MNYDYLATATPLNGAAASVTSQKGCDADGEPTIPQQLLDLNRRRSQLLNWRKDRRAIIDDDLKIIEGKIERLKKEGGIGKYKSGLDSYILTLIKKDITRPQWAIYVKKAIKIMEDDQRIDD